MNNVDFGLYLTRRDIPAQQSFEYYQSCIQSLPSGFTTLWMEDHLQWESIPTLECLTTLSFLAAKFPHFRLGSLVLSQSFRNPALVAKMAANIQLLSQGRLILGLGAGWKEDEYAAYGYPYPTIGTRLEQLEEAICVIKSMWSSLPATFMGQHYRVQSAYCEPQPLMPIPLLIGGGGEKETLRLVARYADWWNFNSCTIEEYTRKLAILRDHCDRVGRDFAEIKLTYAAWVSIAENPLELMQDPRRHIIAGNPLDVIREFKQFCNLGVTHFILKFPDIRTLNSFNKSVLPFLLE
ncbi:MAG TPA: LLM class flavin-dependent oxidoreductase [Ktedonobacteraceae bacterium]|nr:LLM class flavin-dependent oxidoreductase [Ktedonobacteraceae bacterium]